MQFAELKRWQDYRHPGSQGKQYFLGMENAFNGSGEPSIRDASRGSNDSANSLNSRFASA